MQSTHSLFDLGGVDNVAVNDTEIPRVRCSAPPPLSLLGTALAVLLGNILTGILAAILFAIIKSFS